SCTADTSARRASPTAPTASSAISAHSSPRRWPTDFFDADLRGSVLGRGSLSRLAGGSSALAVARFLAACWLGGWCSRDKRGRRSRKVACRALGRRAGEGSRRWFGGPSAGFRRHGCRRKGPMDGFTSSGTSPPHTASTEAARRHGRVPGTPPPPRIPPAAQEPQYRKRLHIRPANAANKIGGGPKAARPREATPLDVGERS